MVHPILHIFRVEVILTCVHTYKILCYHLLNCSMYRLHSESEPDALPALLTNSGYYPVLP